MARDRDGFFRDAIMKLVCFENCCCYQLGTSHPPLKINKKNIDHGPVEMKVVSGKCIIQQKPPCDSWVSAIHAYVWVNYLSLHSSYRHQNARCFSASIGLNLGYRVAKSSYREPHGFIHGSIHVFGLRHCKIVGHRKVLLVGG